MWVEIDAVRTLPMESSEEDRDETFNYYNG